MVDYPAIGEIDDPSQVRVALIQNKQIVHAPLGGLGLQPAGSYQPLDAGLTDIAGLAVTDGNIIVGDGTNWVAESGATARTSLGVGAAKATFASVATTSGTSIDFTGIPAGVTRITIGLAGVKLSGTATPYCQIGDSGGPENTGYLSARTVLSNAAAVTVVNDTAAFAWGNGVAANLYHGTIVLTLEDAAAFRWNCSANIGYSNGAASTFVGGSKALTATLDRVRLTTSNGTDTYAAGSANISWEF